MRSSAIAKLGTSAGVQVYEVDYDDDEPQRVQFSNRIRIVHVCWDKTQIACLSERLGQPAVLDESFLIESSHEATPAFTAVETVLRGPEIFLPDGISLLDKGGPERSSIRYKWWTGGH